MPAVRGTLASIAGDAIVRGDAVFSIGDVALAKANFVPIVSVRKIAKAGILE
jgi:hypothetical protein